MQIKSFSIINSLRYFVTIKNKSTCRSTIIIYYHIHNESVASETPTPHQFWYHYHLQMYTTLLIWSAIVESSMIINYITPKAVQCDSLPTFSGSTSLACFPQGDAAFPFRLCCLLWLDGGLLNNNILHYIVFIFNLSVNVSFFALNTFWIKKGRGQLRGIKWASNTN